MVSLAGLSAVPQGYMDAERARLQQEALRLQLQEQAQAAQGRQDAGRVLFNQPSPGQASIPSRQPPASQITQTPQGASQAPSGGPLPDSLDLKSVANYLNRSMPNATPLQKFAALQQLQPYLNQEAKRQVAEMRIEAQQQIAEARRQTALAQISGRQQIATMQDATRNRAIDSRDERFQQALEAKKEQFDRLQQRKQDEFSRREASINDRFTRGLLDKEAARVLRKNLEQDKTEAANQRNMLSNYTRILTDPLSSDDNRQRAMKRLEELEGKLRPRESETPEEPAASALPPWASGLPEAHQAKIREALDAGVPMQELERIFQKK